MKNKYSTNPNTAFNERDQEFNVLMDEMHYHNTINAFVELIVLYGWDTVVGDLRKAMGDKEW